VVVVDRGNEIKPHVEFIDRGGTNLFRNPVYNAETRKAQERQFWQETKLSSCDKLQGDRRGNKKGRTGLPTAAGKKFP